MRILFTGGGTLGSVTPLLALYEYMKQRFGDSALRAAWIGTRQGPEWKLISTYRITQISIFSGKLRRYASLHNFIDPFFLCIGFFQAVYHILRFRPHVVVNAGSYVGVAVVWAAWFVGVPVVLLQLDIRPSLSNIITLLHTKKICASSEAAAKRFPKVKTIVTGIPVRQSVQEIADQLGVQVQGKRFCAKYGITDSIPVVLISGGGTGAEFLNTLVPELVRSSRGAFHIIHLTGQGKGGFAPEISNTYHQFSFVDDFARLAACADVVVSRAGMGTLAELAVLGKPTILIPIPNSHQVHNASYFEKQKAALYLDQEHTTSDILLATIQNLMRDQERKKELARNMRNIFPSKAAKHIAQILGTVMK